MYGKMGVKCNKPNRWTHITQPIVKDYTIVGEFIIENKIKTEQKVGYILSYKKETLRH